MGGDTMLRAIIKAFARLALDFDGKFTMMYNEII